MISLTQSFLFSSETGWLTAYKLSMLSVNVFDSNTKMLVGAKVLTCLSENLLLIKLN